MASLSHRLEYLLARMGMALACRLTPRQADALGIGLGRIAHRLLGSRRRLAQDNMRRALGEALTEDQIRENVRGVFINLGRTVVELARYRKLGREGLKALVDPAGFESVRDVLKKGRGVIVATAHFGNWEIGAASMAVHGLPVDALALTQQNPLVNELVQNLRREIGITVLEVPANARQVFRSLQDNHVVYMAADQHASAGTLVLDFFGRPAAVVRGPALFALRCGCPLMPMLLRRDKSGRLVLVTGDTIYPPESGDEDDNVRTMTAAYLRFLETQIRLWPDQWMWTHNRWKLKPSEGNPNSDSA
jgi:Kdo2-lipid IVA lauroyltransferase/acyltransferase